MAQLLSAKIVVVEEEPRIRQIPTLPTAVPAFLGVTERGPVNTATQITSFEEFVNLFGGFTVDSDLSVAMQGFFQNGGQVAWIVRTVHFTDITNALTKTSALATFTLNTVGGAPSSGTLTGTAIQNFDMEPADTLVVDVDGGGDVTATFDATAGSETSAGGGAPFALVDGQTLTVTIDGGGVQTITFNTGEFVSIGAATAAEVAAVINAEIAGAFAIVAGSQVTITSDRRGTGSDVTITGGTANAVLGFPTSANPGTGDVSDIDAVTGAEVKTVVEADIPGLTVTVEPGGQITITSNTTGPTSSIAVDATSTLDTVLGLDNATHFGDSGAPGPTLRVDGKTDGAYANLIKLVISAATSGSATEFNFEVEDDGLIVETFPNVSMDDLADNFIETIVNDQSSGSLLIAVVDLDSTAADPRPATGTFGPLTGGDNGLVGLDDNDFIGSEAGDTGFHAFDQVQGLTLLVVPGRATSAVHNAMITYAEVFRSGEIFCIFDPPAGLSAAAIVVFVETTAALLNLSEFAAIYWPRIKILNPSKAVFGTTPDNQLVVPPSGQIAGVYTRVDGLTLGGIYKAPAGVERGIIRGLLGFETDETKDERKRDLVYPKRINPITVLPGAPRHIDGSRTLKGNGNFPSIPERRGVIFIETSLKNGLLFLKHSPNTPETRAIANRTVTAFLIGQMRNGAFATTSPSTAFFVDTSEALNPPSVVAAGQMIIRTGLAMAKPAEFIILKVTADTRALEEELASA